MPQNKITVEVAFALKEKQKIIVLQVDQADCIEKIILKSGILEIFPEINLEQLKVGVFGKRKTLADFVDEHDRIEIYRDLKIDPKIARRKKASNNKC